MAHPKDQRSFSERWIPHPLLSVVLVFVWMLLQNDFSMGTLVLGCVLGVAIPIITSGFWPSRPPVRAYGRAIGFTLLVMYDVLVANVAVARLVLFRASDRLRPCWISVPLELKSPEAISLLAGTITMTPGTVSCDLSADGRSLLVHCLDAPDPDAVVRDIKTRYEARLRRIFP